MRFTGKNTHAIMVMLKNAPKAIYPFQAPAHAGVFSYESLMPDICSYTVPKPVIQKIIGFFNYSNQQEVIL